MRALEVFANKGESSRHPAAFHVILISNLQNTIHNAKYLRPLGRFPYSGSAQTDVPGQLHSGAARPAMAPTW